MKLDFCKEISSMRDLNVKTIASLQPNVSPGRNISKFQAKETNFGNCLVQQ